MIYTGSVGETTEVGAVIDGLEDFTEKSVSYDDVCFAIEEYVGRKLPWADEGVRPLHRWKAPVSAGIGAEILEGYIPGAIRADVSTMR
ncbi:hypothetical protein [Arthrobacter sp. MDT1-65]